MTDCICEFGKEIPEGQKNCPYCGVDLTPLHRVRSLPNEYQKLGEEFRKKGRHDEAIEYFVTAITIQPQLIEAYLELCNIYAEKGQYQKALLYSDRGLIISPGNAQLLQKKTEILTRKTQACQPAPVTQNKPAPRSTPKKNGGPERSPEQPQPSGIPIIRSITQILRPSSPENTVIKLPPPDASTSTVSTPTHSNKKPDGNGINNGETNTNSLGREKKKGQRRTNIRKRKQ